MDYAIALCFDSDAERKLNSLIRLAAQSSGNRYMLDTSIPPHVTVAYFETNAIAPIIDALEQACAGFAPGAVAWCSLGAFTPAVLFAAPLLDEYLLDACIQANKLTEPYAVPGDQGHYIPYQWVPHTALAVRLNAEQLNRAFAAAAQHFSAFSGTVNRLVLAQCNPYKELQTWALDGQSKNLCKFSKKA